MLNCGPKQHKLSKVRFSGRSRPGDLPTLTYLERPKFRRTILIAAWLGGLTRQKLPAGRYARSTGGCRHKIRVHRPRIFYDFSQQRPR